MLHWIDKKSNYDFSRGFIEFYSLEEQKQALEMGAISSIAEHIPVLYPLIFTSPDSYTQCAGMDYWVEYKKLREKSVPWNKIIRKEILGDKMMHSRIQLGYSEIKKRLDYISSNHQGEAKISIDPEHLKLINRKLNRDRELLEELEQRVKRLESDNKKLRMDKNLMMSDISKFKRVQDFDELV